MPETMNPRVVNRQLTQRKWVEGLLVSAQNRQWFGRITIEIKRGMIHLVSQEETLKPPAEPTEDGIAGPA